MLAVLINRGVGASAFQIEKADACRQEKHVPVYLGYNKV
jgi:hypothetical protein